MRELSIRNNAKNLQLMALYEKIQETDPHPNINRTSILDRALDYAIANTPDFSYLAAVKLDLPAPNLTKSPEVFHIKASEEKLNTVSDMLREYFNISIVQIPFLIKLVLTGYYIEKIQNSNTRSFPECYVMNTVQIKKASAKINSALAETEGQSKDNIWEKIHILKEASVQDIMFYDLKDEWKNFIPYAKQELSDHIEQYNGQELNFNEKTVTPWQKICCYKIAPNTFDCDVSLRMVIIYALAFPYTLNNNKYIKFQDGETEKFCIKNKNFEYHGDTMNSYAITIHEYLRTFQHDPNNKTVKNILFISSNKWGVVHKYSYFWEGRFEKHTSHWEACVLDNYDYFNSILLAEAKLFISLTHTIGNFIPTPPYFQNRGNTKGLIQDYWDLTLLAIYNYYFPNIKNKKRELNLENISPNSTTIRQWLDEFHNWDTFVEQNYMQDFVNEGDGESKYGEPKELWKGHFSGDVLPVTEEQFKQFFTNASAWITARSTRIATAVKRQLNNATVKELIEKLTENGGE